MIYEPTLPIEEAKVIRMLEESLPTPVNAYAFGLMTFGEALQLIHERNVWFNTLDLESMRYLQS